MQFEQNWNNKLVTLNPSWHWQDFYLRVIQISQQLKQDKINSVALMFEDSAMQACVMLGCFHAGTKILLPPNLLADNVLWIEQNAQLLLNDSNIASYATEQIAKPDTILDLNNNTEIWLKTSGSSGKPKILIKTASQMWQEAKAIAQTLAFPTNSDLYVVSSVSSQHHYGLSYRIMLPLYMGWKIARYQQHYPELMIADSEQANTSIWITSPALLNNLNLTNTKLASCNIYAIISAGSALSATVSRSIHQQLQCPVIECYGSTETGAIAFRYDDGLWTPTIATQVKATENSTLWVKSTWLDKPEIMADAVEFVGNQFKLLGRIDRIIKFGDKRISLANIEQQLLGHSWIKDCYIGSHPQYQRPAAWIALSPQGITMLNKIGRNKLLKQLRYHLSQTQDSIAIPRFWRISAALPRNAQAKISLQTFNQIFLKPQQELGDE